MKSLFQTRSSGTDLAFYVAAGREQLLEERKAVGKIERGNIAVTNAYNLKAKYIIHTVGPIWTDGQQTRQNERKRMINI